MNNPSEPHDPATPSSGSLSAALARAAFEAAPQAMFVLDTAGVIQAVNEAFRGLYGLGADRLAGRAYTALSEAVEVRRFGRDEKVEVDQWIVARALRGEATEGKIQLLRDIADGREIVVRCGAFPAFEDGRVVGVTVSLENVTETMASRQALQEQTDRYAAILEAERAVTDAGGDYEAILRAAVQEAQRITQADGACVEIQEGDEMVYVAGIGLAEPFVGLRLAFRGSLSGRTVLNGTLTRSDDCEVDDRVDREACRRIGVRSMALAPLRYDHRSFGVLKVMSAAPSGFTNGDLQSLGLLANFLGAAIGRERATRALLESEARFRAAVGAVGTLWTNSADGRMVGEQPGWAALTGQSPEEYEGYGWASVVHPEDAAPTVEAWNEAVREGRTFEFEHRVRATEGGYRQFAIRAVPVRDASGEMREWVGVHIDITDAREAVEALRRSEASLERRVEERTEELTRANRDLDEFAYSVAHDLRAPLRTIVSTSRLLQEDLLGQIPEDAVDLLDRQARAGVRLAKIVDDLLGFARLAKAEMRLEAFDMTGLARKVAEDVEARRKTPCRIEVQSGMQTFGDPSLVGYALTNLVDNACKFSPEGGLVTVGQADGAFFVQDRGVGFDMAHAGKLFTAFERLVGQDAFEGTGVGLANVKRIVEKHGGRIWAESEPGKGAIFRFTLG